MQIILGMDNCNQLIIEVMLNKILLLVLFGVIVACKNDAKGDLDLSSATILISSSIKGSIQETIGNILVEEIEKRTAVQLSIAANWDAETIIALVITDEKELYGETVPAFKGENPPEIKKEGYRIFHEKKNRKRYRLDYRGRCTGHSLWYR